jgi:hypothetical protein
MPANHNTHENKRNSSQFKKIVVDLHHRDFYIFGNSYPNFLFLKNAVSALTVSNKQKTT